MGNKISSSSSSGVGFLGLLTITFIILKLIGIITWSWWWVLAPLWVTPLLIIIALSIIYFIVKGR